MAKKTLNQNAKYVQDLIESVEPDYIFSSKPLNRFKVFDGNDKDNKLSKLGDVNFWIESKAYNLIENAHQALLLSLVDLIIGKSEYPPN